MNKFKFDFNYIKKNLNIKNFLKDIYALEKDSNKVSGDKYGGGRNGIGRLGGKPGNKLEILLLGDCGKV